MADVSVPVLIVGAGPTGLSTALFLAQQQIPYLLIETIRQALLKLGVGWQ